MSVATLKTNEDCIANTSKHSSVTAKYFLSKILRRYSVSLKAFWKNAINYKSTKRLFPTSPLVSPLQEKSHIAGNNDFPHKK